MFDVYYGQQLFQFIWPSTQMAIFQFIWPSTCYINLSVIWILFFYYTLFFIISFIKGSSVVPSGEALKVLSETLEECFPIRQVSKQNPFRKLRIFNYAGTLFFLRWYKVPRQFRSIVNVCQVLGFETDIICTTRIINTHTLRKGVLQGFFEGGLFCCC